MAIQLIYATLAAVLHLGNIQFAEEAGKDGVVVSNPQALRTAARLLKLPPATFNNALVNVRTSVRGEVTERSKSRAAAQLDLETLTQGHIMDSARIFAHNRDRAVHSRYLPDLRLVRAQPSLAASLMVTQHQRQHGTQGRAGAAVPRDHPRGIRLRTTAQQHI